jgi:hypothetical protein
MANTFFDRLEKKYLNLAENESGKMRVMALVYQNTITMAEMSSLHTVPPELQKTHQDNLLQWIECMKTGKKNAFEYDLLFFANMPETESITEEILGLNPQKEDIVKLYNFGYRQAKNADAFTKRLNFINRLEVFKQGCDYAQVADQQDAEIAPQAAKVFLGLLKNLKYCYDEENDNISKQQWYQAVWSHFKNSTGLEHLEKETIINYLNIYIPSEEGSNTNKKELIRSVLTCFKNQVENKHDLDEEHHVSMIKYRVIDWLNEYNLPVVKSVTDSVKASLSLLEPAFERLNINQINMTDIKNGMSTIFIESKDATPIDKSLIAHYMHAMLIAIPDENKLTSTNVESYWKNYWEQDAGKILTYCILQENVVENPSININETENKFKI